MGKRCGAEVIRRHSTEVIRSFPLCAACTDVEAVSEGAGDSTNFARTVCAAGSLVSSCSDAIRCAWLSDSG